MTHEEYVDVVRQMKGLSFTGNDVRKLKNFVWKEVLKAVRSTKQDTLIAFQHEAAHTAVALVLCGPKHIEEVVGVLTQKEAFEKAQLIVEGEDHFLLYAPGGSVHTVKMTDHKKDAAISLAAFAYLGGSEEDIAYKSDFSDVLCALDRLDLSNENDRERVFEECYEMAQDVLEKHEKLVELLTSTLSMKNRLNRKELAELYEAYCQEYAGKKEEVA